MQGLRRFNHVMPGTKDDNRHGKGENGPMNCNIKKHNVIPGMNKLIPITNKLQNIFSTAGKALVGLPQIVVVGAQSSGKSSVLESIVGYPCFPRGRNTCTRCPIVLQMIHKDLDDEEFEALADKLDAIEWFEFPHLPMGESIVTDVNQVHRIITDEVNRRAGGTNCVINEELTVRIISPNVIDLTLVDLPGLVENAGEGWPEDIKEQIKEMVTKYISNPNSIILAVSKATDDIVNSPSISLAKTVDPKCERTIAVLTQLDLMDPGTDATDVLTGQTLKLKLGIIGVVNRSYNDTKNGVSMEESVNNEATFLMNNYATIASENGIPYLKIRLQRLLMEHIAKTLPHMQTLLTNMQIRARSEFEKLGTENTTNKSSVMLKIIEDFCNVFKSSIFGKNRYIQKAKLTGGAQINLALEENLAMHLKGIMPHKDLEDVEILTVISNSRGIESSVLITEAAYQDLVRDQIQRLEEPALKCASSVNIEILKIMDFWAEAMEKEMKRFPNLTAAISIEVTELLNERHLEVQQLLRNYVDIQASHIKTIHIDFNIEMCDLMKSNALTKNELLTTIVADDGRTHNVIGDDRTETQRKQCTIVRQLVQNHFEIVKAAFQDYCPKAIAHTVIYFMETNIQRRLIEKLYTTEKIDQLVQECCTVTRQRKCAGDKIQVLDYALDAIREIRDTQF